MRSISYVLVIGVAAVGLATGCASSDSNGRAVPATTARPPVAVGQAGSDQPSATGRPHGSTATTGSSDAPEAPAVGPTAVEIDATAARLAIETVRQVLPGAVDDLGESVFGEAFASACAQTRDGESSGRPPDATGRTIAAGVADIAVLTAVDSFLFNGGCGDSLYVSEVRDQVLAELNRR